jgi:hypothetical protein
VKTLRDFRDNVLMKSAWGPEMVGFYYRHSLAIACYLAERDSMRTVTRWLLTPIVIAIAYPWWALMVIISLGILLYAILTRLHNKPA